MATKSIYSIPKNNYQTEVLKLTLCIIIIPAVIAPEMPTVPRGTLTGYHFVYVPILMGHSALILPIKTLSFSYPNYWSLFIYGNEASLETALGLNATNTFLLQYWWL